MRQSKLVTKTSKNINQEETSANAQLLVRAGFIDKLMAGVYTLLPMGKRMVDNIEQIIREEMDAVDGQELVMPALTPKQAWTATGRWDMMQDILYTIKDEAGHEYALGPTHEEIVTPLVKQFVHSYKDMPVSVYQFQNKFRKELRPKSGILRGREFLMKDMYSFHTSQADLDAYYDRVKVAYTNVFKRLGIGEQTYLTAASGGVFSKYSHEYQTVTPAGEDLIYICSQCSLAINREIKDETPACPECGNASFKEEKAIEVGNIFKLGNKFSSAINFTYTNQAGAQEIPVMGCYGIGLTRLMGTIVEVHHDDRGMILPRSVSPYEVHLINLNKDSVQADSFYVALQQAGFSVLYDDRAISAGAKLADADLYGFPFRLVTGSKTGDQVEVKLRNETETKLMSVSEFIQAYK